MPKLIELVEGQAHWAEDAFVFVADEDAIPESGDVILSLARFQVEGDALLSSNSRRVGVRIEPDQEVEALAYDLPRLAVVALAFPKYRDGRAYTQARLLRERYGYRGELRATGQVLRDQFVFMLRAGFDAFEVKKQADAEAFTETVKRYSVFYQPTGDGRLSALHQRLQLRHSESAGL